MAHDVQHLLHQLLVVRRPEAVELLQQALHNVQRSSDLRLLLRCLPLEWLLLTVLLRDLYVVRLHVEGDLQSTRGLSNEV